jgi:twitching motility protein PilT
MLESIIRTAREQGASDAHLEAGMPVALRVRGQLRTHGEALQAEALRAAALQLLGTERWNEFAARQSFDLSRTMAGVRCRINVFKTARGVSFAIRLLARFDSTLTKLNLHPDIGKLTTHTHGLILVSGATGSGKTSTLAALIQEINNTSARHIITVESPIEYAFTPHKSFIRQREVGRDTPSFEQALRDALREDPDVLMVGEMRDPETMRLTLNAAETGHLVLATMHSSNVGEAAARIVSAFPAEVQAGVGAQLADVLVAIVCQQLVFRADLDLLVPECEILLASAAARAVIRQGQLSKLQTVLESGAGESGWSRQRYRDWLQRKMDFYRPKETDAPAELEMAAAALAPRAAAARPAKASEPKKRAAIEGVIEIEEDIDPAAILSELSRK